MTIVWPTKTLSEVCEIRPPKAEARRKVSEKELVSFVPMEDLGVNSKYFIPKQAKPLSEVAGSYTYFADGDVLLAKITPCFENGKLGIASNLANGIGFGSSEYFVFRPSETITNEWLYYFLSREAFRDEGASRMAGAVGHKRVAKEFIETCPIPVPPLTEQKRIVAILDEAFDGIATAKANTEKNLQNARAVFATYLDSIFADADEGGAVRTLDEVCIIGDGNHSSNYPKKEDLVEKGVPFIRATNLVAGHIDGSEMRYLSPQKHLQLKKGHLKTGDILITNRGEIGKTAIVDANYNNANLNSQIAWLRCREEINNKFLFQVLNSGEIQKHFQSLKSGAALQQFTIKQLKALRVPVPRKLAQQAIAAKLERISQNTKRLESIY